jgi:hypothetical protein
MTCRYAKSCKELLSGGMGGHPKLQMKDGVYKLDFEGMGAQSYYCDMTTDDGGWTALVNPVIAGTPLPAHVASLTVSTMDGGGGCGFGLNDNGGAWNNGWNAIERDTCDNGLVLSLSWINAHGANDVMFDAILQATTMYSLSLNGTVKNPDVQTVENGTPACFIWNGAPVPPPAGPSGCAGAVWCATLHLSPLPPPHQFKGVLTNASILTLVLTTGPNNDTPDGCYNKGAQVQRLFVR